MEVAEYYLVWNLKKKILEVWNVLASWARDEFWSVNMWECCFIPPPPS